MSFILFDEEARRSRLLPFTFTRPIAAIRCGIYTIAEKWELLLKNKTSFLTVDYLSKKFPTQTGNLNIYINGAVIPTESLVEQIKDLTDGSSLFQGNTVIALASSKILSVNEIVASKGSKVKESVEIIHNTWDIFQLNGSQIDADVQRIKKRRLSEGIQDEHTVVYRENNVFVEEGANIKAAIINAENGTVYIGKNAQVQEGSIIQGPFALCEGSVINPGGKMRPGTTVGPYSKVGGEISNSVIFGYSNKGHEGFLGNAVIGEWCNLGADTNNSNLKNDYGDVKLWSYVSEKLENTAQQFCGLMMGDHSKCGVNTMFNTGTVVGVNANIFGPDFPNKFTPSFSWGGNQTYSFDKALEVAKRVMSRREVNLTQEDQDILKEIFNQTAKYRS